MSTYDIATAASPVDTKGSHGWIQYKGTDICVDLHCVCGTHGHYDGYQMYQVACVDCGRHYAVDMNIMLVELTPEQLATDIAERGSDKHFIPFREDD